MYAPCRPLAKSRTHLDALLWVWFALGAGAIAAFPAMRGYHPSWGWAPFWCVVAPLIDLALLHRNRLLAWIGGYCARLLARPRRRRQAVVRAARPRAAQTRSGHKGRSVCIRERRIETAA